MTKRESPGTNRDTTAISRRSCVHGAIAIAAAAPIIGAAALVSMPAAAEDNLKTTKKLASYQDQPKGSSSMCANCKYFIKPASCVVVEGTISPQGWCQRFDKRSDK